MILADKITENRKKCGWSQEDLAYKLGVSRQSVSKWESAQAVPDMKKILQLADLFGVSTDYLLREDIEEAEPGAMQVDVDTDEPVRRVSMEEASSFLDYNRKASSVISTGVMLCILSPVLLIVLAGLSEAGMIAMAENAAAAIGVTVLLVMIAAAVCLILSTALRGKRYEYLEEQRIDTDYGVTGMAREQMEDYSETHSRLLIIGIMLCVIAAIPTCVIPLFSGDNDNAGLVSAIGLLLCLIAAGVKLIVLTCIRQEGYQKLLQEGDYTPVNKRAGKFDGIYWMIATAVYLAWSFLTSKWQYTWIVWPVAGVLFAAYREIIKLTVSKK